jgi:hypothetical protein
MPPTNEPIALRTEAELKADELAKTILQFRASKFEETVVDARALQLLEEAHVALKEAHLDSGPVAILASMEEGTLSVQCKGHQACSISPGRSLITFTDDVTAGRWDTTKLDFVPADPERHRFVVSNIVQVLLDGAWRYYKEGRRARR